MDQHGGEHERPPTHINWPPSDGFATENDSSMSATRPRRTFPIIAWAIIIVACLTVFIGTRMQQAAPQVPGEPRRDDPIANVMVLVQGRYLVGAAQFTGDPTGQLHAQARKMLNHGSVSQRQRFVVLAAELAGVDEARDALRDLETLIEQERERERPYGVDPFRLTQDQAAVQRLLRTLYADDDAEQPNVDALTTQERELLVTKLDWFGRLALVPQDIADPAERDAVLRSATAVLIGILLMLLAVVVLVIGGIAGWIIMLIKVATLKARSAINPGEAHHGVYAETFAIWLVLFFGMLAFTAWLGSFTPHWALSFTFLGFFASLIVLGWPVLRGVPWRSVRQDIGLTTGRGAAMEATIGIGAYAMTVPLLILGVVCTFILMNLDAALTTGARGPLDQVSPPAHPIIGELLGPSIWPRVQLLMLAVIAAPIVEEIIFRGVFYRHLRDATRRAGLALSVLTSTIVSAFIFALIHPQGLVAIPVLMSLAVGFALAREWRGSLVPAIIMHGLSNGLVLTFVITVIARP